MFGKNGKKIVAWVVGVMFAVACLLAGMPVAGVRAAASSREPAKIVGFPYYLMRDVLVGPGCIDHRERQYMEYLGARKVCLGQKFDVPTTYSSNLMLYIETNYAAKVFDFYSNSQWIYESVHLLDIGSGTYIFLTTDLAGGTSGPAKRLDIYHAQRDRIGYVRSYDIDGTFGLSYDKKEWWYTLKEKRVVTAKKEYVPYYNAIEFVLGHDPIDRKKDDLDTLPKKRVFCLILHHSAQLEERDGPCPGSAAE